MDGGSFVHRRIARGTNAVGHARPCLLDVLRLGRWGDADGALGPLLAPYSFSGGMSFKKDVALKPGSRVQVQRLCSLISRNLQYATSLLADLYRATKQHSEKTGPATVSSVQ